jgi:serine/threonine protein phosphatase PrpC
VLKTFSITDIGRKRKVNQDYIYTSEKPVGNLPNVFIVADGMGGHRAGDYASRLCVETMVQSLEKSAHKTPVSLFEEAVTAANKAVFEESASHVEYEGMGTTVVACTLEENTLYIANIGDSRLYLIRDGIEQITDDHSLVEEMVKQGNITESEARIHPQKNIITRALGINEEVQADFFEIDVEQGDVIMLCSDGLSNMIEDEDMEYIVKNSDTLQTAAESLVARANENGGNDNITVVLAEV